MYEAVFLQSNVLSKRSRVRLCFLDQPNFLNILKGTQ